MWRLSKSLKTSLTKSLNNWICSNPHHPIALIVAYDARKKMMRKFIGSKKQLLAEGTMYNLNVKNEVSRSSSNVTQNAPG